MASSIQLQVSESNQSLATSSQLDNFMSDGPVYYNFTPGSAVESCHATLLKDTGSSGIDPLNFVSNLNKIKTCEVSQIRLPLLNPSENPVPSKRTSFGRVLLRKSNKENQSVVKSSQHILDVKTEETLPGTTSHDYTEVKYKDDEELSPHKNTKLSKVSTVDDADENPNMKLSKKKMQSSSGLFSSWRKKKMKGSEPLEGNRVSIANISLSLNDVTSEINMFSDISGSEQEGKLNQLQVPLPNASLTASLTLEDPLSPCAVSGIAWKFNENVSFIQPHIQCSLHETKEDMVNVSNSEQATAVREGQDTVAMRNVDDSLPSKEEPATSSVGNNKILGAISISTNEKMSFSRDIYSDNVDLNLTGDISAEENSAEDQHYQNGVSSILNAAKPCKETNLYLVSSSTHVDSYTESANGMLSIGELGPINNEGTCIMDTNAVHNMYYPYVEDLAQNTWQGNGVAQVPTASEPAGALYYNLRAMGTRSTVDNANRQDLNNSAIHLSGTTLTNLKFTDATLMPEVAYDPETSFPQNNHLSNSAQYSGDPSVFYPKMLDDKDAIIKDRLNDSTSSTSKADSDEETFQCSDASDIGCKNVVTNSSNTLEDIYDTRYTSRKSYVKINKAETENKPSSPLVPRVDPAAKSSPVHETNVAPCPGFSNSLYLIHPGENGQASNIQIRGTNFSRLQSENTYRISEACNYYELEAMCPGTKTSLRKSDSAVSVTQVNSRQEDIRGVDLEPGIFNVDILLELYGICSPDVVVPQKDKKIVEGIKNKILEWRKKNEWLKKRKRNHRWKKMGECNELLFCNK